MTYTPPPNDAIELEFTEYTPDAGDAVTIPIQEALDSNIALSNDAVDFTFDTTDAYQPPVNDAVNFELVDIVSVVGATVEEPLTIPAPTGSGPANVPLTTSGQPPLPSGVTNDGQFAWGDTATPETDSATVVLQWTRPQPAIDPPSGIDVAEVVTATYTPPDGTPTTVTERLIDPARDPNTGTQQDTPVAIDQNPPAGDVTYQVKLFYYDETAGQHGTQVVSRTVDTTEAVQFKWPDTISDPTTRVTTVDLRREGPLTVPDTATIVSDVVTGRYDGTTYTLGSGGLAGRGILHDVNAPAGMITYTRTITYDTQSGTRETVSKTRMKDTRAPPAPLSVTAQRTGTTIDQSLPYDYLFARVSPQSVPVTATPTIATAEDPNAIPDSEIYIDSTSGGGSTSFSSDSNSWTISLDIPGGGGAEMMVGLVSGIDFSDTDVMKINWEKESTFGWAANFGADVTQSEISDAGIDAGDCEYSLQIKSDDDNFSRQTDSVSVGGDANDLFVGVGGQLSSGGSQSGSITVYEIYGEDSQGNEVWNMDIPSNL